MQKKVITAYVIDNVLEEDTIVTQTAVHNFNMLCDNHITKKLYLLNMLISNENHCRIDPDNVWISRYANTEFYRLFRMKKETFHELVRRVVEMDSYNLIQPSYHGGNHPVDPEKKILVFLWYMATQDTLLAIADKFNLVPSTVMAIVNDLLHIMNRSFRQKYIVWPTTVAEYQDVINGFSSYPGVIGALDGTHINIKVSKEQEDSYRDRYHQHSINIIAICSYEKLFTYVFAGFPGSAHDARVFDYSLLARDIEQHGPNKYFPHREMHVIGDKAFPLREWLMVPYRDVNNMTPQQRYHNRMLSKSRICIEHAFGLVKGRWRRTIFVNTYAMAKAVEIANAAFVLHNFCYVNLDEWDTPFEERPHDVVYHDDNRLARVAGERKRDRICQQLYANRH